MTVDMTKEKHTIGECMDVSKHPTTMQYMYLQIVNRGIIVGGAGGDCAVQCSAGQRGDG